MTKIPYPAQNPYGEPARVNNPNDWVAYVSACEAVEAGKANGVGFVLTDTPFAAFDLDDCFIEGAAGGEVSSWARKLIEDAGSYTEVTPSGSGLRIIGTAQGNPIHCTFPMPDDGSLEIYRKATRYITATGQCDDEFNKLINIDAVIDAAVLRLKPGLAGRKTAKPNEAGKVVPLYTQAEAERIISALSVIPAGNYDNWFKIGAAVRSTGGGEAARQIWDDWSRTYPEKFDEVAQERTWQSFDRPYDGEKVTLGTLFATKLFATGWFLPK